MRYIFFLCFIVVLSCQKTKVPVDVQWLDTGKQCTFTDALFYDDNVGFMIGGEMYHSAEIFKTTDGGLHWQSLVDTQMANTLSKILFDIRFSVDSDVYICGQDGLILSSKDSGNNWLIFRNQCWAELKGIQYPSKDTGLVVGDRDGKGMVIKLSWYGETLERHDFPSSLYSLLNCSGQNYIAGGSGMIIYSSDNGSTWTASDGRGDRFIKLLKIKDGSVLAFGLFGTILQSYDNGQHWNTVRNGNSWTDKNVRIRNAILRSDGSIVLVGDNGFVSLSYNDCYNWQTIDLGITENLFGATEKSNGDIMVYGSHGRLFILKNLSLL